jgi:hypothetical protein
MMMRGLGSLLAVVLLHAAMLAPIVPLSDALATTAAHASESDGKQRFDYGWLRAIRRCRIGNAKKSGRRNEYINKVYEMRTIGTATMTAAESRTPEVPGATPARCTQWLELQSSEAHLLPGR